MRKNYTLMSGTLFLTAMFSCVVSSAQIGAVDTSFNTADSGTYSHYIGGGYSNVPFSAFESHSPTEAVLLSDNKSLVIYSLGESFTVKRINADGSIDNSFNFGDDLAYNAKIFLQPDGKFITANDYNLKRYNSNGTQDLTFNGPSLNGDISKIKFTAGGKMYIIGYFTTIGSLNQKYIARLNSDGTNDTSFSTVQGFDAPVLDIEVLPDGKILAGGQFTKYNNNPRKHFLRLNSNGSYDSTLTTLTTASGSYFYGPVSDIEILPNGKILAAGVEDIFFHSNYMRRGIVRLNSNYTYDTTFDPSGLLNTFSMPDGEVDKIVVQPDGKYLIHVGVNNQYLFRLESSGAKDTSFDYKNIIDTYTPNIIVCSDGKIMAYYSYGAQNGITRNGIHRINSDGSLDFSFNPLSGANSYIRQITPLNDGKLLITGNFTSYNDNGSKYIARIHPDGTFDDSFATDPTLEIFPLTERLLVRQQQDGKLLIASNRIKIGVENQYFLRLNTDGMLDTGFTWPLNQDHPTAFDIAQNGKILGVGLSDLFKNSSGKFKIVRINANGSIDNSYPDYGFDQLPLSLTALSDGKILVSGSFLNYNNEAKSYLIRLNSDGTRDTSFNFSIAGTVRVLKTIPLPDGKIIISYDTSSRHKVARLNNNGSVDTTFFINDGMYDDYDYPGFQDISVLEDGRVLIKNPLTSPSVAMENFNTSWTTNYPAYMLNANGTWDQTFVLPRPLVIYDIVAQGCSTVLYSGLFKQVGNVTKNNIARVNITNNPNMPAGSSMQTFTPGETLADLDVNGQDVQWYSSPSTCMVLYSNRSVMQNNEMPLPLSTPLENGVTYYATQTVNELESLDRLAVTANAALSVNDNNINKIKLYPNPANSVVTISNHAVIDGVDIYNIYGQKLKSASCSATEITVNIDSLTNGVYIFTVKSGSQNQSFKVIKN